MQTLGARLTSVEVGKTVIDCPFDERFTQQHGFLHAGVIASIVDSACGYAALTILPPAFNVLTVEFKINLLKPASGTALRAIGKVVRAGRTLVVCTGEACVDSQGPVAVMQATIMAVREEDKGV